MKARQETYIIWNGKDIGTLTFNMCILTVPSLNGTNYIELEIGIQSCNTIILKLMEILMNEYILNYDSYWN